jgi:hypothetical protein
VRRGEVDVLAGVRAETGGARARDADRDEKSDDEWL